MARQSSKSISLKDGYYLAVRQNSNAYSSPILVRRDSKEEVMRLLKQYSKVKNAEYYGHVVNNKIQDK